MITMGIDIGSASSKVVILEDGDRVIGSQVVQSGTGSSGPQAALDLALAEAGISLDQVDAAVATGYGRRSCPWTKREVSEISCHAKGIASLYPNAQTIIDIGGQDAKVISLGKTGTLTRFFMNDKCAAGTGRFLEVMARVLEVPLAEMAQWHDRATAPAAISNTCTVFAESEVISQLSAGTAKADIIAGVHRSVASKASSLAFRAGVEPDVIMSGGVAQNSGVVKEIARELRVPVTVARNPQLIGALGAALYAFEDVKKGILKKEDVS